MSTELNPEMSKRYKAHRLQVEAFNNAYEISLEASTDTRIGFHKAGYEDGHDAALCANNAFGMLKVAYEEGYQDSLATDLIEAVNSDADATAVVQNPHKRIRDAAWDTAKKAYETGYRAGHKNGIVAVITREDRV